MPASKMTQAIENAGAAIHSVATCCNCEIGAVMPARCMIEFPRVTRFENESPRDLCNPPQCSLYLFIESRRLNRTYVNFTSYHSGYCSRLNGIHPCKLNCTPNICQSIDQPVQQFGPGDKSGNDNRIDRCNQLGTLVAVLLYFPKTL